MINFKKIINFSLILHLGLLFTFCEYEKTAQVNLESKSGSPVKGKIYFFQNKDGDVKMLGEIENLSLNSSHAIHIHEKGDCSSLDAKSAGGHWNPNSVNHGKWGKDEFHSGDIGNLKTDKNGKATIKFTSDIWQIGGENKQNILGKAVVIHQSIDDFSSQPSGNAGKRIACGVINLQKK